MSVSSVTLDEVLAAAQIRGASLVPETSGYLALAIADASARLPFQLDDTMIHLSTEGTVKVARGTEVVDPEQSAATVRDMLARLLARSIGGMPGLSSAARPRQESTEGVERVIGDIEAALIPVNRAAARRALARLARETVKTKESGKLRRRAAREARNQAARDSARPLPREAEVRRPAPATRALPPEPPVAAAEPRPLPAPERAQIQAAAEALDVDVSFSEAPPVVEARPMPVEEPAVEAAVPFAEEREPTPTEAGAALASEEPNEPTTIDSVAVVLEQARIAARTPVPVLDDDRPEPREARRDKRTARRRETEATFEAAEKKSVDDLLASFSVSAYDSDGSMKSTRATLKRLAGLDPTPPPPSVAMRGLTPPPPRVSAADELTPVPTAHFDGSRRNQGMGRVAMVVVGLVLAGLLGHYVPTWLDRTGSSTDHDEKPSTELSRRN